MHEDKLRKVVVNWIFQGNPDYFDVDSYLRDCSVVNWTVRQKHLSSQINIGDKVYFWRSSGEKKGTAGIIAIGEIVELPRVFAEDLEALKYWKVSDGAVSELRVVVNVTHRLPPRSIYSRKSISENPTLSKLKILKFANATNYKITDDESLALHEGFFSASKQEISLEISAYSWTIESSTVANKVLDRSAFLHRGTGIPKEIRPFFLERELSPGESHPVSLVFQGQTYAAHIDMEGQDTARTRLFWNVDFTSLLKETFPHHYQQYSTNQTPDTQVILRLKRLSGFDSYEVSFTGEIPAEAVEQDIESEELEEKGPQKEGGVREYYGKRYERSAVNRQQAIKFHGLSCNACGFNFEKVYGARGADYIEVHHVKPIHTYEQEQHVDPKTDLITLCSNCHRMTHRDRCNVLSMDALKELISELRGAADE